MIYKALLALFKSSPHPKQHTKRARKNRSERQQTKKGTGPRYANVNNSLQKPQTMRCARCLGNVTSGSYLRAAGKPKTSPSKGCAESIQYAKYQNVDLDPLWKISIVHIQNGLPQWIQPKTSYYATRRSTCALDVAAPCRTHCHTCWSIVTPLCCPLAGSKKTSDIDACGHWMSIGCVERHRQRNVSPNSTAFHARSRATSKKKVVTATRHLRGAHMYFPGTSPQGVGIPFYDPRPATLQISADHK